MRPRSPAARSAAPRAPPAAPAAAARTRRRGTPARAAPRPPAAAPPAGSRASSRRDAVARGAAAVDVDARLQLVELVGICCARALRGAAHQHRAGQLRRGRAVPAARFSSPKRSVRSRPPSRRASSSAAAPASGRPAGAARWCAPRCWPATGRTPRPRRRGAALVVLQHARRRRAPAGSRRGRASRVGMNRPTVRLAGLRYVAATRCTSSAVDLPQPVAVQEQQAPVAHADPLAELQADALGS